MQEGRSGPVACRSVVLWFDVEFSSRFCAEHPVTLSTDPRTQQTHWVQSLLTFRYAAAHPASPCYWFARCDSLLEVRAATWSCAARSLHLDKVTICVKHWPRVRATKSDAEARESNTWLSSFCAGACCII